MKLLYSIEELRCIVLKNIVKNHQLFIVFLCFALVVRIILAIVLLQSQYSVHDDLMRYQDWGRIAYHYSVHETYKTDHLSFGVNPNNQPPGTVYIDLAMYALSQIFSPSLSSLNLLFLKLPSIFADLSIGVMIYYWVVRKSKHKYALIATSLFIYNPVVLYNSAVWGQIDALNNLFFFASLLLLSTKKYFISVLMFFLSLYIKLSLLPLLPLYLIFLLRKMQWNFVKVSSYVLISFCSLLLLTLPVSLTPHSWLTEFFIKNSLGELQYITNYTFNFWSVLFNPDSFSLVPLSSDIYFGMPLSIWAYMLFGLFFLPLLIYAFRQKKLDDSQIMGLMFLAAFAVFLLFPRMHQRYIYPALPLMATYIGMRRQHLIPYLLLSVVNFINLYVVWHPSDFLPTFLTNIIAHSKIRLSMSVLTLGIFLFLYIRVLWGESFKFNKSKSSRGLHF